MSDLPSPVGQTAAERIAAERLKASREAYEALTAQFITEVREKRGALLAWPWWKSRLKRRTAIDMYRNHTKLLHAGLEGGAAIPDWDAPDAVFEGFLRRFAEHRNPATVEQALEPFQGGDRTQLHLLFLDFALTFGGRAVQREFLRYRGHDV